MNTKQSVALLSTSALAAGVAQGAIVYSGQLNLQQNYTDTPDPRRGVDMTGDGVSDVIFGYEQNVRKPYVDARTGPVAGINQSGIVSILGKASNSGLPVTVAGTSIDSSYATTYPALSDPRGYFCENSADGTVFTVVGDWSSTATTDAYVGIKLNLGGGSSYGWLHIIDNPAASPANLTLVDWAYESTSGAGILAGAVPEPSSAALGGMGLAALLMLRKRRRSA